MKRAWGCAWAAVVLLGGCASGLGFVGHAHVQATAQRQCQQMPSMEQRKQCMQTYDTTLSKDMRPLVPRASEQTIPADELVELERKRREALCIRREGQAPLCPN